jgi:hypothetical protein
MPEPSLGKKNDVRAWQAAVDNAQAQLAHQQNRCVYVCVCLFNLCLFLYFESSIDAHEHLSIHTHAQIPMQRHPSHHDRRIDNLELMAKYGINS